MDIASELRAGDRWNWTESLSDYSAASYTLYYYLRGPELITLTGVASGTDHAFTTAAATTAGYKPGVYDWIARVVEIATPTNITTIDTGRLSILVNLATATHEYRSFWRQVLDQLEPVILGRAGTDQLSMSVAGRSLQRMTWDELLRVYDRAKLEVASDQGDGARRYVVSPQSV